MGHRQRPSDRKANSKQQTANSKQQTANSKQQRVVSRQPSEGSGSRFGVSW
jgi:hypothetical protein